MARGGRRPHGGDARAGEEAAGKARLTNLNPLKYCFHGQHSQPRISFRTLPGKTRRQVCAECYAKIKADRLKKKNAAKLP